LRIESFSIITVVAKTLLVQSYYKRKGLWILLA
jgi:hypothetical protein